MADALPGQQSGTALVVIPQGFEFGHEAGIAAGVSFELVQAQADGFEVARVMLQTLERRVDDETFADQPCHLGFDVLYCRRVRPASREFFQHALPLCKNQPDQAADFLQQKAQARFGFLAAGAESGLVERPGGHEAGALHGEVKQLFTQLVERAERHVLHPQRGESRQVFFEVLELFAELQLEQALQSPRVNRLGFFLRVENPQ